MVEINFERPFKFKLDVIEIDERTPAFQVEINIHIDQCTHKYNYTGEVWIEYNEWDRFINSLKNDTNKIVYLQSISNNLMLSIETADTSASFKLMISKIDTSKNSLLIEQKSIIDVDTYSLLKSKFIEFPVWW